MSEPKDEDFDFAEFITELAAGRVNQELGNRLANIIRGVEETKLQGELNIKLKVKEEGGLAKVDIEAREKVPRMPMPGSLLHFADGKLTRDDPRQMELRDLGVKPGKLKTLNGGKDEDAN